jgi:hypothetical protein
LQELLEFAPCDPVTYIPLDYPNLAPCFRVYPITYRDIFPPWLRMRAYRTFQPEELGQQIQIWKSWRAEILEGRHRRYLLDVYLYETTLVLIDHWQYLQGAAQASLSKTTAWAQKPAFLSVRHEILNLPCPELYLAPICVDSAAAEPHFNAADDPRHKAVWEEIEKMIALARAWDSKVKKSWKLRHYRNYYRTFDRFLGLADDPWLVEFLNWANECCARGMGLYLDY